MYERGAGGNGCLIGCGVAAFMMLLIPMLLFGSHNNGAIEKGTGAAAPAVGGCALPGAPKISDQAKFAQAIDEYIKGLQPKSPMVGTGADFVKAGIQHGVNPAWVIAIAQKESSFGLEGFAAENANNAFGRTATDSQPHVNSPNGRKWYKYDSFAQSAYGQSEYLKRRYIDKGLTTIEKITYTYAPPSENKTDQYIAHINQWMGKIIALAGSAVDCGSSDAAINDNTQGPPGNDIKQCKNVRKIPDSIPVKGDRLAHTTLVKKLEQLWEKNKTWRVTEACPPSSTHADKNHYNGRAVDIAIFPKETATEERISKLLEDVRAIGFDDILDEYHKDTTYKTGGHIHLEWHGK